MKKLFDISQLPTTLQRRAIVYAAIAIGTFAIAIGTAIKLADPKNLFLLLLTAYFGYMCGSIIVRWNLGKILEIPALCISVQRSAFVKTNNTVLFSIAPESLPEGLETPTLTIGVPAKSCPFAENVSYLLYVDRNNMSQVIAQLPVS